MSIPVALSIAGSDPSGGAGIQADLKTFTALGVYGEAVITSITVQNTTGVFEVYTLDPSLVYSQIEKVVEDIPPSAVKIGMLGDEGVLRAVVSAIREFNLKNVVLDTVLRSKDGARLFNERELDTMVRDLFPLVDLVTPNIPEAEKIWGKKIENLRDMENCARDMYRLGSKRVLIKGGHLEGSKSIDLLYTGGEEVNFFVGDRVDTPNTHGTGCTLSSAIASFLAKGLPIEEAVSNAKEYVQGAIENSLDLGRGNGPLNHLWRSG